MTAEVRNGRAPGCSPGHPRPPAPPGLLSLPCLVWYPRDGELPACDEPGVLLALSPAGAVVLSNDRGLEVVKVNRVQLVDPLPSSFEAALGRACEAWADQGGAG